MNDRTHRYRSLLNELLFEREAAGGELPESQESAFVERLDELWWQLSSAEQREIDKELAEPSFPEVVEEHFVDCDVGDGSSAAPRKAA
jgi:hypothetical protein